MDDLICNQTKIPKQKWRYGFRSSAATGCGWIATYNALGLLGYRAEPEKLIRYFERQLPLIHGNCGTAFWAPALYFHKWGFPVTFTMRRKRFNGLAQSSDVCILLFHWHRRWRFGSHFVALQHKNGEFIGYNTYTSSHGPDHYGPDLDAFLKRQKYYGCILIGIRRKERKEQC